MTSHSCTDKLWLGLPIARRHWVNTPKSRWSFEWNLRAGNSPSVGFDICDEEWILCAHLCLFGAWLSLAFASLHPKARLFVRWFNMRFGNSERSFRIGIHDACFRWHFFHADESMSRRAETPRWWQYQWIRLPWHREWLYTEILTPDLERVLFREDVRDRRVVRRLRAAGKDAEAEAIIASRDAAEKVAKATASRTAGYCYVLKSGAQQNALATFYVERRAWGMRWLPLPLWGSTTIWVDFDQEIGERTGSWKGGTRGCGYRMQPGETAFATLARMERERKFDR